MPELSFVIPCLMNFYLPETASKAVQLFKKLGYQAHIPENQGCCGYPFLQNGEKTEAKELAQKLLFDFQTGRRNHHICPLSPICHYTISTSYPKLFHNSVSHNLCQKVVSDVVELYTLLLRHQITVRAKHPTLLIPDNIVCLSKLASLTGFDQEGTNWRLLEGGFHPAGGHNALPIYNQETSHKLLQRIVEYAKQQGITSLVFTDEFGLLYAKQYLQEKGYTFEIYHLLDILYAQTFE